MAPIPITDILLLDRQALAVVSAKYPCCVAVNLSNTSHKLQQYRVTVDEESEDAYFAFLTCNGLDIYSLNFLTNRNGAGGSDQG